MSVSLRMAAAMILLSFVGCSSSSTSSPGFSDFFDSDDIADAIVDYSEQADVRVSNCMVALGYPAETYSFRVEADLKHVLYGIVYLDSRHIENGLGYGLADFAIKSYRALDDAELLSFEPESLEQSMQYNTDYRSCRETQPGYAEYDEILFDLQAAALDIPRLAFEDGGAHDANVQWAACMQRDGYRFETPLDAYREIEHRLSSFETFDNHEHEDLEQSVAPDDHRHGDVASLLEIQQAEVDIASDDLSCRQEVGAQYAEIADEIERDQAAKYQSQMERLLEIVDAG